MCFPLQQYKHIVMLVEKFITKVSVILSMDNVVVVRMYMCWTKNDQESGIMLCVNWPVIELIAQH